MDTPNRQPLALIHRHSGEVGRGQSLGPYHIEALLSEAEEGAGTVYRVRIEPRQRTSVSYHRRGDGNIPNTSL